MPAAACVRVFAPPEDRVRELFAGPSQQQHAADRKVGLCDDQHLQDALSLPSVVTLQEQPG